MEQGRLEPVESRVKNNKRGLGSKEPKPKPKVDDDEIILVHQFHYCIIAVSHFL